jgi:uncharacterized protein YfdQ (DUF2303 family)
MSDLSPESLKILFEAGAKMSAESDPGFIDDDGACEDIPVAMIRDGNGGEQPQVFSELIKERERRMSGPRRRAGRVAFSDLESFCAWVDLYKEERSLIWSDANAFMLTAVIDEHPPGNSQDHAGWREFRATYEMPRSAEWTAWTANDSKPMTQDAFADFVESRLDDLVSGDGMPRPTDVLTMARDLHVHSKGTFQRTLNPTTGNYTLVAKTDNDTGSTVIPRAFLIAIPVFEGGERYQVEARIRFQLREGVPTFSYSLHRRREIERDAFNGAREKVRESTELPVLAGRP